MRIFFTIVIALMLAACGTEIHVSAALNATKDIKTGDPVYLESDVVGEVVEIQQRGTQTLLTIELNNKGQSSVKQNAAIVVNRLQVDAPLEIYNKQTETELIQDGAELTGLSSMFQLGAWMVGDSLNAGTDSLSGYVDAFQRYLGGEQFQQDKQVMQETAKQLGKDVQGMAKVLTDEVKKTTKDLGITEEKAAQAIEQLGNELAPVIGELSKSSQAIVTELEKFTQNIESQGSETKELGSTVLSSLLQALETVNENITAPQLGGDSEEAQSSQSPQNSQESQEQQQSSQAQPQTQEPKQLLGQ